MSTRSCIAFATGQDKWEGRYHHSGGYPEGLGAFLFESFNGYFTQNLDAMKKYLFTDHPAGYSCIIGADLSLPAGYLNDYTAGYGKKPDGSVDHSVVIPKGPRCFCHGDRHEDADLRTSEDVGTADLEWLYVLEFTGKNTIMHVSQPKDTGKKDSEGYRLQTWERVVTVDLHGPEPDWDVIACGDNLERCSHVAEKHFPELAGTTMARLSTDKFMGREPLSLDDACTYIVNGHILKPTGSGTAGNDNKGKWVWIATVMPEKGVTANMIPRSLKDFSTYYGSGFRTYDGGSFDIIVSTTNKVGKAVPYKGVTPVYPPTMNDPIRLFEELRKVFRAETTKQLSEQAAVSSQLAAMLATGRYFRDADEKCRFGPYEGLS
jgi:hypothetical protein